MANVLLQVFARCIHPKNHQNVIDNKYVPGSTTLLMPLMNYWWEFCVQFIPPFVAPNLVTLSGFIVFMLGMLNFCYQNPSLATASASTSTAYYVMALCWFTYDTLDCIDGKHARNTKNSSPLGQLFDHGVDAIVCTFATPALVTLQGEATSWFGLYWLLVGHIIFYLANWKARHLGKFDYGLIGVTEFEVTACVFMCCHGVRWVFESNLLRIALFLIGSTCVCLQCVTCHRDVSQYYKKMRSKNRLSDDIRYELGNFISFEVAMALWYTSGVYRAHPLTFVVTIACSFAHFVHKLIVCEVAKQRADKFQSVLIPYFAVAFLSAVEAKFGTLLVGVSMADVRVVRAMCAWSVFVMVRFGVQALVEMSYILNIRIFAINPPETTRTRTQTNEK